MFKLAIIFVASLAVFSLAPAVAQTDFDILNFALNLECLEAEYYSNAVYGYGLNTTTLGSGPGSTGGLKANLSPELLKIATELANDEINHVTDLRSVLGSSAVPCPKMDIGGSFTSLGKAALNVDGFFPYNSDVNFLLGAFLFEDVGVTAFHGAIPQIVNKSNLETLAGISPVEAYHAAILRTLLYQKGSDMVTPYNVRVFDFVQGFSNLRGKAGNGKDQGIVVPPADGHSTAYPFANLVPQDGQGLAFSRTPYEVLAIVYGGNATTPGTFYPQGMNGYFKFLGAAQLLILRQGA
uniref:Putative extracellular protein CSOL_059b n=1 Tax=Pseudococcomyxa simplex TaxID=464287 RepID=A0A7L9QEA0_9CHLO|nr:putative extracellular protein CSOL_059b [Pseudococcomyxa simplex]